MIEIFFNISLIIIWFGVPVLWYLILRTSGFYALRLSIPSVVVNFILLFQYLGFPILFFDLDEYRAEFVIDKGTLILAWLGTSVATTLFCIGTAFSRRILEINPNNIRDGEKISSLSKKSFVKLNLLALASVVVLIVYVDRIGLTNLAFVVAVSQTEPNEVNLARSIMGNDFGVNYHWYNFFMRHVLTFCVFALMASLLINRNFLMALSFSIFLLFSIISQLMAAEKGLIADFIISMFFTYIIVRNRGEISPRLAMMVGSFVAVVLALSYMTFMGDQGVDKALWSIISRTLTGSMQPLYHYVEFIPYHQDWLMGRSFPNPGAVLPFQPYNLTMEVMNFVYPEHLEAGVVGSMPTIFWGELFANFGPIGVVLVSLLLGMILCTLDSLFKRHVRSAIGVALFVWLLMHYKNLSITSFSTYIFDLTLALMVVLYLFVAFSPITKYMATSDGLRSPVRLNRSDAKSLIKTH